jgi:tetratricopeptide (TPR) repeat protein
LRTRYLDKETGLERSKLQNAILSHSSKDLSKSEYVLRGEAVAFYSAGHYCEASERYRMVLALNPENADTEHRLAVCLYADGRPYEAIKHYKAALELNLDRAECFCDLGVAYQETGQYENARAILLQAVANYPDHAPSRYNLASSLLAGGEFERGWQEHEWRSRLRDGRVRSVPFPSWNGESLHDTHLLVFAEQGVGDEVMFTSCIPDLQKMGATSIHLECDPRLQSLFERSFPEILVTGLDRQEKTDWARVFPDCEKAVPIASLARHFRNRESDFPALHGYLKPNSLAAERWRTRYAALGDRPKIGLSWRGGRHPKERLQRTTKLSDWSAVLQCDAEFINLQYGDCGQEIADVWQEQGIEIHDWEDADPLADLDDFFSQVSELDLVISTDNSTVHFAGAAGVPVWNLLPQPNDFRWMLERDDSPWYPSMRLLRQSSPGDWRSIFDDVGRQLEALLSGHGLA